MIHTQTPNTVWQVEFPANPNLLCLHTRVELTHEMSERFPTSTGAQAWPAKLLDGAGITQVQVLRHHLRIRKDRDAKWDDLLPFLQSSLTSPPQTWQEVTEAQKADRKRTFPLPAHLCSAASKRLVCEGVIEAQAHPLLQRLFSFPGLLLVVLDQEKLQIKRAISFAWDELQPQVEQALSLEDEPS